MPLVGIYNINTHEILLFPTFTQKITLITANTLEGNCLDLQYTAYYDEKKSTIERSNIHIYNNQKEQQFVFPARFIESENGTKITPHEYLCNISGVPKEELPNYRGFAYIPGDDGYYKMEFRSGSLNSERDAKGAIVKRQMGAEPNEQIKQLIIEKVFSLEEKLAADPQYFLDSLKEAIDRAQKNYQSYYNGDNEKNRGYSSGFFSFFRHGFAGQHNAENFNKLMGRINSPEESFIQLKTFLTQEHTRYHTHSFASYVMDEVSKIIKQYDPNGIPIRQDAQGHYLPDEVTKALGRCEHLFLTPLCSWL